MSLTPKQQLEQVNNPNLLSILSTIQGLPSQESLKHGAYVWKKLTSEGGDFVDYVVSDNETAYPDGGEQGGYWYEKVGACKVEAGTITVASYPLPSTLSVGNPFQKSKNVKFVALFQTGEPVIDVSYNQLWWLAFDVVNNRTNYMWRSTKGGLNTVESTDVSFVNISDTDINFQLPYYFTQNTLRLVIIGNE